MAAPLIWYALFLLIFLADIICQVLRCPYTREEVVKIFFTTFLTPAVELLDILVKGVCSHNEMTEEREVCHNHGHCTPLPEIFLFNVHSLCNKLDIVPILLWKTGRLLCIICCLPHGNVAGCNITEICTSASNFRVDRFVTLSSKTKGGGICFDINSKWCNAVTLC